MSAEYAARRGIGVNFPAAATPAAPWFVVNLDRRVANQEKS
jgi:hypothetical protein